MLCAGRRLHKIPYLQRMQQLGREERVSELVAQLRGQYKQRRALLDELNKAFGR